MNELERIAKALESIADSLEKIAHPLLEVDSTGVVRFAQNHRLPNNELKAYSGP